MKIQIRNHFNRELSLARELAKEAESASSFKQAWLHLERAHILSQAYAGPHIWVHVLMLKLALKEMDVREIIGQIPRIILAGPGSLLGRAPKGNTGASDVGIFTPMEIPNDLLSILNDGTTDNS